MAIIGSAYVNIRAITDKLEDDIERALAGIKDTFTITVDADTARAREKIEDLIDSIEAEELYFNVLADTTEAEHQVDDFIDNSNRRDVQIQVDAATVLANRQIAWATRPRFVEIFAELNKTSWAKALLAIQAMSGSRVLINYFDDLARAIGNMDKNAVKITALSLALTTLASVGIGAVGGIVTVINDLFGALGLLVIAPGMFAGFISGALTTFLALKDMKDVLKDLGPAFTNLQDSISAKFWTEAEKPIREMVDRLLPDLKEGFDLAAVSIGQFFGQFATSMADAFDEGVFVEMMKYVADSTDIAKNSLNDMSSSMAILGGVGASYLPRLATWWVDINAQFNAFLQRADADGTLVKWADNSIEVTKLVGRALWSIGEMFYEIDRAATAAGGRGLVGLTENMEHFVDLLAGDAVQSTLTSLFRGAGDAMSHLAAGLGRFGSGIAAASGEIETTLRLAGTSFEVLLAGLGRTIADPTFRQGLVGMFDGFYAAVQFVYPSMQSLGSIFGGFMELIGTVAASIGRVLGPAISALAPIAGPVFQIIGTIFTALSTALAELITIAAPYIETFAGWLGTLAEKLASMDPFILALGAGVAGLIPFIGMIVGHIVSFAMAAAPLVASMGGLSAIMGKVGSVFSFITGPIGIIVALFATAYASSEEFRNAINGLVGAVMGLVGELVAQLMPPIMTFIQQLLPVFIDLFNMVIGVVVDLVTQFTPLINLLGTTLIPLIVQIVSTVLPQLASLFETVVTVVMSLVNAFMPLISQIIPILIPLITTLVSALGPIITAVLGIVTSLTPMINMLISQLVPVFMQIAEAIIPLVIDIITLLAGVLNELAIAFLPIITTIIEDLIPIFVAVLIPILENVLNVFKSVFEAIIPIVQSALQIVKGIIEVVMGLISGNWDQVWNGIKDVVSGILGAIGNAISGAMRVLLTLIGSGMQNAIDAIKGWVGGWTEMGGNLMKGLANGIKNMVGDLVQVAKDAGKAILNGVKDFLGIKSPSRVMRDQVGVQIGAGIIEGMKKSESAVSKAADSLARAAMPHLQPLTQSLSLNTSRDITDSVNTLPTTINSLGAQNAPGGSSSSFMGTGGVGPNLNFQVFPSEKMSEEDIGRTAANELYWQFINR